MARSGASLIKSDRAQLPTEPILVEHQLVYAMNFRSFPAFLVEVSSKRAVVQDVRKSCVIRAYHFHRVYNICQLYINNMILHKKFSVL